MAQFVANPRVTFAIVGNDNRVGPDDQRVLIVGQMTTGTATPGALSFDVPRTDAEINDLFGSNSHAAMVCRAYRSVNKITNIDVIPLADASGGTFATATSAFTGTATRDGTLTVTSVSDENHKYNVDVLSGDTAAGIVTKILAQVSDDRDTPFTAANGGSGALGSVVFTASNKGTHANSWLLRVTGTIPGISYTLTGWAGGATNPTLTSVFDPILTIRYQTILWPASYDATPLKSLLNARKNVDNNIMDGIGFTYRNVPFGTVKTEALALNSSEIVLLSNEPTANAKYIGPHIPEAPDVITAKTVAALDLRLEPDVSVSNVVATNAPNDQFGGIHMNSLPAFNTPLIGVGMPERGSGYTLPEQVELENSGVSIIGVNRSWNEVITSVLVTTWQNDIAGNPDNTWKYLEWRRTHGAIREYFQRNCQKHFRQMRLTTGTAVAGYSMVDEPSIRAFCKLLYIELTQVALTVAGIDGRTYFENNLNVTLVPSSRMVRISSKCPMVSQLGQINGSIEYTFETN